MTATDGGGADMHAIDNTGKGIDVFAQNGTGFIKTDTDGMDLILGGGYWGGTGGGTSNNRFVLKPDGKIGIGTSSPASRLTVNGTTQFGTSSWPTSTIPQTNKRVLLTDASEALLIINNATNTIAADNHADIMLGARATASTDNMTFGRLRGAKENATSGDYKSYLAFWTVHTAGGTESEKMRITSAGNVGIGTTTVPSGYRLAVDGNIIAEKVRVKDSASWPDYVFASDYNLMPLNELDAYIASNGHLPEVPSSEEVAANGINLGESQALLLKKIEELTLYMIEVQKENEVLKERVRKMEEK